MKHSGAAIARVHENSKNTERPSTARRGADRLDPASPAISGWLKSALRAAPCQDQVDALNDLDLLEALVQYRSQILIDRLLAASGRDASDEHAAACADAEHFPGDASRDAS